MLTWFTAMSYVWIEFASTTPVASTIDPLAAATDVEEVRTRCPWAAREGPYDLEMHEAHAAQAQHSDDHYENQARTREDSIRIHENGAPPYLAGVPPTTVPVSSVMKPDAPAGTMPFA